MPRGLVAMARSGGHCPLRVSGGILCSERGQSRDEFQAIPLEETSPRCNNKIYLLVTSNFGPSQRPCQVSERDPREIGTGPRLICIFKNLAAADLIAEKFPLGRRRPILIESGRCYPWNWNQQVGYWSASGRRPLSGLGSLWTTNTSIALP